MKCAELKAYKGDVTIPVYGTIADAEVYLKDKADEAIEELNQVTDKLVGVKKSAEQILQNLLDCGLIKEWYFNGKFNVVLKADDPHLQIAELKGQVNGFKNRAKLWEYNALNEHNAAVEVRIENEKLKAKIAEKDKEIAELKEQYKDMDVTHTVHIAKMNAKIDQLEDDVAFWKAKAKGGM